MHAHRASYNSLTSDIFRSFKSGQINVVVDIFYTAFLHQYANWAEQHRVKCKMSDQSKILILSPGLCAIVMHNLRELVSLSHT